MSDVIDIAKLCSDFLNEEIPYQLLIRSICEYEDWIVPAYSSEDSDSPALAMLQSTNGKTYLALFSSVELLQEHLQQNNKETFHGEKHVMEHQANSC